MGAAGVTARAGTPERRAPVGTPDRGAPIGTSGPGGPGSRNRVLVVGDVIRDIIVCARAETTYASDTPARIEACTGGSAANQAAWLGALGVPVRFAARVGAADADVHRSALEDFGVQCRLALDPDVPTGTIVIVVSLDGERTMYTDRGANLRLSAADLPVELLDGVRHLHATGYTYFEPGTREALTQLRSAAEAPRVTTSVDPSSASFLRDVGPETFLDWVRGTDLVFPNLDEGRVLTGRAEPDAIVEALLERFPVVALTLGADGALLASRDGERCRVPAPAVRVVDTTGAGDAFCAAFLAAWSAGEPLEACARRGVDAGASAATRVGARPIAADRAVPPPR